MEVLVTNNILDLSRRDADIAIRPTRTPDPHLVGKRVGDVEFGIYAARDFLQQPAPGDIFGQDWIGFDSSLRSTPPGAWFESRIPQARVCLRGDSFVGIRVAAENGIGLALLPCLLGDSSDRLERLPMSIPELSIGLWLLTHPDLMRSARVNAFFEYFSEALDSL